MAELKTKKTQASVTAFPSAIPDPERRKDARAVASLLRRVSLYLTSDLSRHGELLSRLGRYAKGKGCLHVRRLADVDPVVLEELVRATMAPVASKVRSAMSKG
jgi:hypothetical protein